MNIHSVEQVTIVMPGDLCPYLWAQEVASSRESDKSRCGPGSLISRAVRVSLAAVGGAPDSFFGTGLSMLRGVRATCGRIPYLESWLLSDYQRVWAILPFLLLGIVNSSGVFYYDVAMNLVDICHRPEN